MKKYIFLIVFGMLSFTVLAQDLVDRDVKAGDLFVIGSLPEYGYKYIDVPKANLIIKRGGVASEKRLAKTQVKVTSVEVDKDGATIINIARTDNGRFFGSHTALKVSFKEALENEELLAM